MFMGTSTGMVSATMRPPASAARLEADSWRGTRSGTRASTVSTFQLSGRWAAMDMSDQQVDLLVAERVETALHDGFERRPLVAAHRRGTERAAPRSKHDVTPRAGRRRRSGLDERVVENPSPPASMALAAAPPWPPSLFGCCLAADGVGPHHVTAQGAVTDEEPGVDRDALLEPPEVLAERLPTPVDAVLQGGEGHAFDLGHHAPGVVGVLRLQRGEGEPAVAPDDGGHAVHVGGRGERIPEQLGVVVRVRIDEARRHHQPAAVERRHGGLGFGRLDNAPGAHGRRRPRRRERRCRQRRWRR